MVFEITVDDDNLVRTRARGVISDPDVRDYGERLFKQPKLRPAFRHLVDLTEIEQNHATAEAARYGLSLSRQHRDLLDGSRLAIVASADATFGLARMFELMADGEVAIDVHVFRTSEEAMAWLDVPPETDPQSTP